MGDDEIKKPPPPKVEKPLKGLLITGGGYHDYKVQKGLITKGTAMRANIAWQAVLSNPLSGVTDEDGDGGKGN